MHQYLSKIPGDSQPHPSRPSLYDNDSHSFYSENQKTCLNPGDRVTAHVCGDFITGTVQIPDPDVLFGAAQRGAEFAYYRDRVWRVEFLADDGSLVCCHSNQCQAAGDAT
jgi:hypothetical protein